MTVVTDQMCGLGYLDEEQGVEFIKSVLMQRFQFKKELDASETEFKDISNSIQNFEQETYQLSNGLNFARLLDTFLSVCREPAE